MSSRGDCARVGTISLSCAPTRSAIRIPVDYDGFAVIRLSSVRAARSIPAQLRPQRTFVPAAQPASRRRDQKGKNRSHSRAARADRSASVMAARRTGIPSVCTVRDYWPVCYWGDVLADPDAGVVCPGCSASAMTRCLRPRTGPRGPPRCPSIPYMRANLRRKQAQPRRRRRRSSQSAVMSPTALRERAPELGRTRIETIPNGVDVPGVRADADATPVRLPERYAVFVGKLAKNKGVHALVDVAAARPSRDAARRHRRRPGARSRRASGRRGAPRRQDSWDGATGREVFQWLRHAELLVFPSVWPEPLSRVLIEASALSVPIAAMNTGGTADIIVDEETGLLSTSVSGLAEDVARLASDAALSRAARQCSGDASGSAVRHPGRDRPDGSALPGASCRATPEATMRSREGQSLRVAVVARSVYPLHRFGGLERHVYDLVRCLLSRDVQVTLITPPASADRPADAGADAVFRHPKFTMKPVPYVTFPFANRRGTTILDRSTRVSAVRAACRAARGASRAGRGHRHRSWARRQRARLRDRRP